MSATIILTDPRFARGEICMRHPGWPMHIAEECQLLTGIPYSSVRTACSICDLTWDCGRHCSAVDADGTEEWGRPLIRAARRAEPIEIRYDTEFMAI